MLGVGRVWGSADKRELIAIEVKSVLDVVFLFSKESG